MPRVVARTSRQILREMTPDDAEGMFALNADPEVIRYTGDEAFASVDAARVFLEAYVETYSRDNMARWAAIDAASGTMLGWCGLRRQPEGDVDLGYRYFRAHWGRGLATEASHACLELAFGPLHLPEVIARAHLENAASIRVLEKLGMSCVGPSSLAEHPAVLYRITAAEHARTT